MNMISMSLQEYSTFVETYNDARRTGKESFTFQSQEFVTNYAMYLIEYLNTKEAEIKYIKQEDKTYKKKKQ